MSRTPKVYVLQTTLPNGSTSTGTHGLPYKDMVVLRQFYRKWNAKPVLAPVGTPILQIVCPMQPPQKQT